MKQIRFAILCVLFLTACAGAPTQASPQPEEYLNAITENQTDLVNIAALELAGYESITLADGANPHVGLRVYPDQPFVNNGKRAEITFNFPFSQRDTIVYEWQVMVPRDFDSSEAPDSRWWSVAQWHDQPNVNNGETWDNFPAHSPPVAIEYLNLDGRDHLGFFHGVHSSEHAARIPFTRGEWIRIRIEIHWSQGEDGSAMLFLNNNTDPTAVAHGANMLNDYQHYFKIGQYRDPKINTDNTIYFDDIQIYRK